MFGRVKTPIAPKGPQPANGGRNVLEPRPGGEGSAPGNGGGSASAKADADSDHARSASRHAEDDRVEKNYALKTRIHRKLVEKLDLTAMDNDDPTIRDQVGEVILSLCEEENVLLNYNERQRLVKEILDETFGLGPLEMLLGDPFLDLK